MQTLQGMHEILAPLLFVLYFDREAFAHLMEQNGFRWVFS